MYHLYGRVLHTMPKSSWKLWRTKAFLSVLISSLCSYFMVSRFALTNQNQPHILPRCSVLYVRCWRADWSDWRTYSRIIFFSPNPPCRECAVGSRTSTYSTCTYKNICTHNKCRRIWSRESDWSRAHLDTFYTGDRLLLYESPAVVHLRQIAIQVRPIITSQSSFRNLYVAKWRPR